ncbi:N-acetyltransferase domain-containing protein [Citrus sinensis]|uniref:N-acetyltransferase domain-containing protein n=1 Tax=Citrus sinensis TaxID=2711 RepID=A0ACB8I6A0_CITSI|nr:N-acetyltransferase domain-containing protein [Citrus sinensis]
MEEELQKLTINEGKGGNESDIELSSDISLRLLDLSDIDDFMVWASDEKVTRFCSFDSYTSKEDGINYIKNTVSRHPWYRAICVNNRPVGSISVTANSGNDKCRGELGYVLAADYWGKGIATKAVKMVANTIFDEWPHLERLEALVVVDNAGSQRVLEKAGFKREAVLRKYLILKGTTRDCVIFSLLSTDPRN